MLELNPTIGLFVARASRENLGIADVRDELDPVSSAPLPTRLICTLLPNSEKASSSVAPVGIRAVFDAGLVTAQPKKNPVPLSCHLVQA